MYNSIGFTGTREGMTTVQLEKLIKTVKWLAKSATEAHHGCCIGADEQFHVIASLNGLKTHSHPSTLIGYTAKITNADIIHESKPPLDRNQDIVDASDILIATPKENYEVLRSGTWSTIRKAQKKGIKIIKIFPNGIVEEID